MPSKALLCHPERSPDKEGTKPKDLFKTPRLRKPQNGSINDRSFPAFAGTALLLPGTSLRGSAAHRTTRRLCRSQHLYDGRAVCFCVTRQSHVTSLRGWFLGDVVVAEGRVGVSG